MFLHKHFASELAKMFKINSLHELRIYFLSKEEVTLTLTTGRAEIYGSEIIKNKKYVINSFNSISIFTWNGCTVKITGKIDFKYVTNKTLNLQIFKALCRSEKNYGDHIIKTVAVGKINSGINSIFTTLINYFVRLDLFPLILDFDLKSNLLSIPGTISIAVINRIVSFQSNFDKFNPFTVFFGHELITKLNYDKFIRCVDHLIEVANKLINSLKGHLIETNQKFVVLVKCNKLNNRFDYSILNHIKDKLNIPNIITIGLDYLGEKIKREIVKKSKVFKLLSNSDAIEPLSSRERNIKRSFLFKKYFYGPHNELFPTSTKLKFGTFAIYKCSENFTLSSVLPKDEKVVDAVKRLKPHPITKELSKSILGVCSLEKNDPNFAFSVYGFVQVVEVNDLKGEMTLLCHSSKSLLSKRFLYSDIKWFDN